jgi:quercetin dioxygenase-like cupin family protein
MSKTHWIADADLEWEILDENCKRKIMAYTQELMIVKVHFKKGAIGAIHQHIHTQASYVESGVF